MTHTRVLVPVLLIVGSVVGCDAPPAVTVYDTDGSARTFYAIPAAQEVIESHGTMLGSLARCQFETTESLCKRFCMVINPWDWECTHTATRETDPVQVALGATVYRMTSDGLSVTETDQGERITRRYSSHYWLSLVRRRWWSTR